MFIGDRAMDERGQCSFAVLIGGAAQPLYRHEGGLYVAAQMGSPYSLQVTNHTGLPVEVVCVVDQRDTQRNQIAYLGAVTGVPVAAHGTHVFRGWRFNGREVGEFVFGQPPQSVAAQAADGQASTGIIGFAVYTQAVPTPYTPTIYPKPFIGSDEVLKIGTLTDPYGDTLRSPARFGEPEAGTEIGRTLIDPAIPLGSFRRSEWPPSIVGIAYDTAEALAAQGITGRGRPDPFLVQPGGYGGYARTA